MEMLLEVGDRAAAEQWVLDALEQKQKIMGFGHREYKNGDSRVPSMKKVGRQIAEAVGDARWPDLADAVEETMLREKGIFQALFRELREKGTLEGALPRMQTREELYQLLDYDGYTQLDAELAARFPERDTQ